MSFPKPFLPRRYRALDGRTIAPRRHGSGAYRSAFAHFPRRMNVRRAPSTIWPPGRPQWLAERGREADPRVDVIPRADMTDDPAMPAPASDAPSLRRRAFLWGSAVAAAAPI